LPKICKRDKRFVNNKEEERETRLFNAQNTFSLGLTVLEVTRREKSEQT
jgi:hypothetical protein